MIDIEDTLTAIQRQGADAGLMILPAVPHAGSGPAVYFDDRELTAAAFTGAAMAARASVLYLGAARLAGDDDVDKPGDETSSRTCAPSGHRGRLKGCRYAALRC